MTSSLNDKVIQTYLDGVALIRLDEKARPDEARFDDTLVFKQDTTQLGIVKYEQFRGNGAWTNTAELQQPADSNPAYIFDVSLPIQTYQNQVTFSMQFVEDNQAQFDKLADVSNKMVDGYIQEANRQSFAIYRNGFTASASNPNGEAWFSTTHTIQGGTQSNLLTAKLNTGALNSAIVSLAEQKGQDGLVQGFQANLLVVPSALYQTATVLSDTQLIPGSANNDLNVFMMKYGIYVKQTPFVSAVTSGGSDTAWFLMSRQHGGYRVQRDGLRTWLINPQITRNLSYAYGAFFRQAVQWVYWNGAVASNGTTGDPLYA